MKAIKYWICFFSLMLFFTSNSAFSETEDLNEMMRRKNRISEASWGYEYVEDSNNGFVWQPESFSYSDKLSGKEIWRLTGNIIDSVPGVGNPEEFIYDISESPFSADGQWIGFTSRRNTNAGKPVSTQHWIVKPDGSFLRPLYESKNPTAHGMQYPLINWNKQVPNVCYEIVNQKVYKLLISDNGLSSSSKELINIGNKNGTIIKINKTMSMDGVKALAMTSASWEEQYETWLYPLTLAEDGDTDVYGKEINDGGAAKLDDPDGYHWWTNKNIPCGDWGKCPEEYTGFHDQFLSGVGENLWFYFMPSRTASWWRMRLVGSAKDGGPVHIEDAESPYQWGNELEPFNTPVDGNDPWSREFKSTGVESPGYMSHVHFDPWGRYATYSQSGGGGAAVDNGLTSVYDIENRVYTLEGVNGTLPVLQSAEHHAWNAWSDYTVYSTSKKEADSPYNLAIYQVKYNDENTLEKLASTHSRLGGGSYTEGTASYESLPRPTQSPDGTKVLYHSTMFNNNDNDPHLFYVVAYYPYPPEITGAVKSSTNIKINFDFRENSSTPSMRRTYTTRGWPDESNDPSPLPKEITHFRLWKSLDKMKWEPVLVKSRLGSDRVRTDWFFEVQQDSSTTVYYAVTSFEGNSGLESRVQSNIWKVMTNSDGSIGSSQQQKDYPVKPGIIESFYTESPLAPANFKAVKQSQSGQYLLSWNELENTNLLTRYYNIYYSTSGQPPIDRKYRIASLPVGTNKWLDCLADPSTNGFYVITSVDTQGNEGSIPGEIDSKGALKLYLTN
ncbi:MAG: hypothetical protein ABIJ59_18485 [Pseudomonadota bacterium]